MTKKHFIRAAEITRDMFSRAIEQAAVADAFLVLFREFNPRFDTDRFLIACGLQDAPTKAGKGKRS